MTERFDLQVPVVSAPMAGVAGGALAGAVSAAGGLGLIGWVGQDGDQLRRELALAAQPGRAFGIGFLAWQMRPGDEQLVETALEAGASMVCISYGDYEQYVDRISAAGAVAATQVGTLDDVRRASDAGISDPTTLDDVALSDAIERLATEEHNVSDARLQVIGILDTLQDELKRRYKDDPTLALN